MNYMTTCFHKVTQSDVLYKYLKAAMGRIRGGGGGGCGGGGVWGLEGRFMRIRHALVLSS